MVASPILVAYYAAWSIYSRAFFVSDIPAAKITHINYAFAKIASDGCIALGDPWADVEKSFSGDSWNQPLRGNFNQLLKLKETHPHLRTLISIGGWTWSSGFSDVALTPASRTKFAESCVEFIRKYGFDGVDVDWEYPVSGGLPTNVQRPEDKQNYVLLLKELRTQLNIAGANHSKSYLLTVATGAGSERIVDMDLPGMSAYLDWINVMTYDFHGGWDSKTGHNAPLFKNDAETTSDVAPSYIKSRYNCHGAIQGYIAAGASRSKLVMGLSLYGRGWQGVTNGTLNGFSQSASETAPVGTWENGVFDYDHLKESYLPSYTRHWDNSSKVPFLYNASNGIWISYDDRQSIQIKTEYIKREKLAGAMFWEMSSDRRAELIGVAHEVLNSASRPSAEATPPKASAESVPSNSVASSSDAKKISTWQANKTYGVNDRVTYLDKTYECLLEHSTLPGWTPFAVPMLWREI